MPRERRTALFPIALSPFMAAEALGINPKRITKAIRLGELRAYQDGTKRRVLVADLCEWIRETWRLV